MGFIGRIRARLGHGRAEKGAGGEGTRRRPRIPPNNDDFENFVLSLLPASRYTLMHSVKGDPERMDDLSLPDFMFKDMRTGRLFWVVCRYVGSPNGDRSVTWCGDVQLQRYRDLPKHSHSRVFVALGVGGERSAPERFYFFNINRVGLPTLEEPVYSRFAHPAEPIDLDGYD